MNILIIGLVLIVQVLVFFSFGLLAAKLFHINTSSITLTLLSGFMFYFCVFGFIAIPLILTSQKLSTLAYSIIALSVFSLFLTVFLFWKQWRALLAHIVTIFKKHGVMLIPLLIVVFILEMIVFTHIDSSADGSYYIGKVSTDVYTNTMGQYNSYTGTVLNELDGRRVFACFPEYNAVIAYLFHIHPLKQAKLIMPQLLALFTLFLYYQIGLQFFSGNHKKADCFVCLGFFLDLYSFTIYTNSTFLLTRTYEGKSILANIILPGIFLCFLMLWKQSNIKFAKIFLFALSLSSCFFSSSSMLIVPIGLTAGLFIWICKERKIANFIFYVICALPNIIVCILYFLSSNGLLTYSIH